MNKLPDALRDPLVELLLCVADDKLILGHRNADWTGLAPILEEDIAFSSLAQDDLAHAKAFYDLAAEISGRDAGALAYGRAPGEYRCAEIVELADEFDWATAVVRQFFCDHFEMLRQRRLACSAFGPLGALAGRVVAEERLSLGHADQWIVRLGRSGADARARIQAAVQRVGPLTAGLFEPTAGQEKLEAAGIYPADDVAMFDRWVGSVGDVLDSARIDWQPTRPSADFRGGRRGVRSAAFAAMHDELTEVYRQEPNAAW